MYEDLVKELQGVSKDTFFFVTTDDMEELIRQCHMAAAAIEKLQQELVAERSMHSSVYSRAQNDTIIVGAGFRPDRW